MNLAVMLPNWIGDVVMATPTLRAIRRRFADARIVGVMRPYVADVLAGTDWFDDILFWDRRSDDGSLHTAAVARRLQSLHVDQAVLLTNSLSSAWLAWRSGARRRFGYSRNLRWPLLSHRLHAPRKWGKWLPISAVDYYLALAAALGCDDEPPHVALQLTPAERQAADVLWQKLGWRDEDDVIVLNTGGAFGAAKRWPDTYFAELASRLVQQYSARVLIICGPAEQEAAAAIEKSANHARVASLAGEAMSIGLSKACVARSRLMITTDSGPRHFAAAFGVPAVSLFGPTDPRWSMNYHAGELSLQQTVPCGPCGRRVCPLKHHRCMRELTVQRVFAAASTALQQVKEPRAA